MKTRMLRMWTAGALVAVVPLLGGCEQKAVSESVEASTNNPAPAESPALVLEQPAPATTNPPPLAEPGTNRPVVADPAAAENKPLPPGLAVAPSLGEVVKLANAGVEPGVMLSFITNSAGTFNLGVEQIIFLKDIGIPGEVVAAMILHDQAISSGQFQGTTSTTPAPSATVTQAGEVAPAANTTSVWQDSQATNANPYAPAYTGQPQAPAPPTAEATQPAPEAQVPATTAYFQESLAPYGNWVSVEGYGTCWQPTVTVINTAWRPYCDGGRWLYTDCGWYWQSDYAWGGVAFHYGRWFYAPRHGWCWWPNTVWGPSWVTWRSSSAYCGWAPLPPYSYYNAGVGFTYYGNNVNVSFGFGLGAGCYTFVPWNGFCQSRPWAYAVPHHRVGSIYHESTVVNHVAMGPNHAMINHGIEVSQVTARAGRDVARGTIREMHESHGAIQPDRVERQANQHIVYRAAPPTGKEAISAPHGAGSSVSRPTFSTSRPSNPNNDRPAMTARLNGQSSEPSRAPRPAFAPATGANATPPASGMRQSPPVARNTEPLQAANPALSTKPTPTATPFTPATAPQGTASSVAPATQARQPNRGEPAETPSGPVVFGRPNPWRTQAGVANNAAPAAPAPSTANSSTPSRRAGSPSVWEIPARTPAYSQPAAPAVAAASPRYSAPAASQPSPSITPPQAPQRPTYTPPPAAYRAPAQVSQPTFSAPARTYSAPPATVASPPPAPAATPRVSASPPARSVNSDAGGRAAKNVNER